jgi:hypothetical protein
MMVEWFKGGVRRQFAVQRVPTVTRAVARMLNASPHL